MNLVAFGKQARMNREHEPGWRRDTIVVKHLADVQDQQTLVALQFATQQDLGKSFTREETLLWILCLFTDEQRREFRDSLDAFETEVCMEEGDQVLENEAKCHEYQCFLKKKPEYSAKIDKQITDYKKFLEQGPF
eukprot:3184077-Rhodomonas_salina.1